MHTSGGECQRNVKRELGGAKDWSKGAFGQFFDKSGHFLTNLDISLTVTPRSITFLIIIMSDITL